MSYLETFELFDNNMKKERNGNWLRLKDIKNLVETVESRRKYTQMSDTDILDDLLRQLK